MKNRNKITLDPSRLYGFKIDQDTEKSLTPKVGGKARNPGAPALRLSAKIGMTKVGAKAM